MTNQFLKAKHWQLLLLTFGLPIIFQIVMMSTVISNIESGGPDSTFMFNYMKFIPLIIIIFIGVRILQLKINKMVREYGSTI